MKRIPRGTTLSYGEVALRAGKPGAARAVVSALRTLDGVPWWRVARHDGTLAPPVSALQSTLLSQEGWRERAKAKSHREGAKARRGGPEAGAPTRR